LNEWQPSHLVNCSSLKPGRDFDRALFIPCITNPDTTITHYTQEVAMNDYTIKDLMVPRSEYAVINENSTIYEAVLALEKAQQEFDQTKYRHRGMLVENDTHVIVGKVGQLDILRALEPKYEEMKSKDAPEGVSKFGFSKQFLLSMMDTYSLFDHPLNEICKKAGAQKISNYMHRLTEGEFIESTATLDQAIHLLVIGHHQSLLVIEQKKIIGVIRLTDVFAAVFHAMKECNF
jgi:CBS domain-containing protein